MLDLIPLFAMVLSSLLTVAIVFIVVRARQRRAELQAQVQTKLIDRFSSAPELIEFLQSPAGRQFVSGVQAAPARYGREQVVHSVRRAVVMTTLGVAFIVMWIVLDEFFAVPALILTFLGVGMLASAAVSYSLSSKLGLDEQPAAPEVQQPRHAATVPTSEVR
jgi:hypothetical protein